jgi:hypothetical protein
MPVRRESEGACGLRPAARLGSWRQPMREGVSPFGSPPRLSSLRLLLIERPESGDWQLREPMPTLRPCTSLLPLDLHGIGESN